MAVRNRPPTRWAVITAVLACGLIHAAAGGSGGAAAGEQQCTDDPEHCGVDAEAAAGMGGLKQQFSRLKQWLRAEGGRVSKKLELFHAPAAGRGLRVAAGARGVAAGDALAFIPRALWVHPVSSNGAEDRGGGNANADVDDIARTAAGLLRMLASSDDAARHAPHFTMFPPADSEALRGVVPGKAAGTCPPAPASPFEALVGRVAAGAGRTGTSQAAARYAVRLAASRGVRMPGADGEAATRLLGILPLWDMVNHNATRVNVRLRMMPTGAAVVATQAIPAGGEVLTAYASGDAVEAQRMCVTVFFARYGFVDPDATPYVMVDATPSARTVVNEALGCEPRMWLPLAAGEAPRVGTDAPRTPPPWLACYAATCVHGVASRLPAVPSSSDIASFKRTLRRREGELLTIADRWLMGAMGAAVTAARGPAGRCASGNGDGVLPSIAAALRAMNAMDLEGRGGGGAGDDSGGADEIAAAAAALRRELPRHDVFATLFVAYRGAKRAVDAAIRSAWPATPTVAKYKDLADWVVAEGGFLTARIVVDEAPGVVGRHLRVAEGYGTFVGEPLAYIPEHLALRNNPTPDEAVRKMVAALTTGAAFYAPYLALLPPNTVSPASAAAPAVRACFSDLSSVASTPLNFDQALVQRAVRAHREHSVHTVYRAVDYVMSRSVGSLEVVPLFDLANTDTSREMGDYHLDPSHGYYIMRATQPVGSGKELTFFYGHHAPDEWYRNYGFHNPHYKFVKFPVAAGYPSEFPLPSFCDNRLPRDGTIDHSLRHCAHYAALLQLPRAHDAAAAAAFAAATPAERDAAVAARPALAYEQLHAALTVYLRRLGSCACGGDDADASAGADADAEGSDVSYHTRGLSAVRAAMRAPAAAALAEVERTLLTDLGHATVPVYDHEPTAPNGTDDAFAEKFAALKAWIRANSTGFVHPHVVAAEAAPLAPGLRLARGAPLGIAPNEVFALLPMSLVLESDKRAHPTVLAQAVDLARRFQAGVEGGLRGAWYDVFEAVGAGILELTRGERACYDALFAGDVTATAAEVEEHIVAAAAEAAGTGSSIPLPLLRYVYAAVNHVQIPYISPLLNIPAPCPPADVNTAVAIANDGIKFTAKRYLAPGEPVCVASQGSRGHAGMFAGRGRGAAVGDAGPPAAVVFPHAAAPVGDAARLARACPAGLEVNTDGSLPPRLLKCAAAAAANTGTDAARAAALSALRAACTRLGGACVEALPPTRAAGALRVLRDMFAGVCERVVW